MLLRLFSFILLLSSAFCRPRVQPTVDVVDAHGEIRGRQTFLWVSRLSEVKDRVQLKQRVPKDLMVLWYIAVDRDGYKTKTVYDLDDSQTFAEVDKRYNEGRRGFFGVTFHDR